MAASRKKEGIWTQVSAAACEDLYKKRAAVVRTLGDWLANPNDIGKAAMDKAVNEFSDEVKRLEKEHGGGKTKGGK